jgi:hypothetical protein
MAPEELAVGLKSEMTLKEPLPLMNPGLTPVEVVLLDTILPLPVLLTVV